MSYAYTGTKSFRPIESRFEGPCSICHKHAKNEIDGRLLCPTHYAEATVKKGLDAKLEQRRAEDRARYQASKSARFRAANRLGQV